MSFAGLGALINWVFNAGLGLVALYLLIKSSKRNGFGRYIRIGISIAIVVLLIVNENSKENKLDEGGLSMVGTHLLSDFHGQSGCQINITTDHSYTISCKGVEVEQGAWHFFDDGDITFMEYFPDGNRYSHYFASGYQYQEIENN
jgi:hypothetical protein